jgi:hypothetical protein
VTAGAPAADERGFVRPDGGAGEKPDAGAFEAQDTTLTITVAPATPSATVGGSDTFTVRVTNTGGTALPDDNSTVVVTLPANLTAAGATTFRLGALAAGASVTFTVAATATAAGPATVSAAVTSPDTNPASASAAVTVTVAAVPPPVTPVTPVTPVAPVTPVTQTAAPGIFAVGAGPGGLPVVDVYDAATGAFKFRFQAFETGFTGSVRVAVARSNGQDYIAVAAGPGGFLVRTFVVSGNSATLVGQFMPFGTFTGGIFVALGDLRGDGQLEVVTAPDAAPNSDPFFNVWSLDGKTQLSPNVFAFEQGFHGGVRVAIGGVDGNGKNQIIASAGPGGLPFVQVVNGQTFALEKRFLAFGAGFTGGVTVAAGPLDASGVSRIVVGADAGDNAPFDAPVLRTFDGQGDLLTDSVFAFEPTYHGGVNVATSLDGRGRAWVLATPARAHNPQIDIFSAGFNLLQAQTITDAVTKVADANFANGVCVGG